MSEGLVVVSNRLPVEIFEDDGDVGVRHSTGGLARALGPVLRVRGGTWVGWPGLPGDHDLDTILDEAGLSFDFELVGVPLDPDQVRHYYTGFANQVIWPLFHDLQPYCDFDARHYEAYVDVNRRFAEAVREQAPPDRLVWIHDYHLMRVAQELRALGHSGTLAFFLHIPFPNPDVFLRMPWREDILTGLLQHDVLGFQTAHDAHNFADAVRRMAPDVDVREAEGRFLLSCGDRVVTVSHHPINIDVQALLEDSRKPGVEHFMAAHQPQHDIILGVDRLDYTKGIPERLEAFERALEAYPELRGRVSLVQHLAPSRMDVARYGDLLAQIEGQAGHINGRFGTLDWTPVKLMHQYADFQEVLALYRLAKVALVTPLRDGMNLVCKEYCIANEDGTLILSEFAGAADQLTDALLVNPHNVEQMAEAIHEAVTMPAGERQRRMDALRAKVMERDVHDWAARFLSLADEVASTNGHIEVPMHGGRMFRRGARQ